MLQDLIAAALNAALTNAQQMIQQEMQAASAGLAGLGSILGDGGA
jgi:DNA-binding protein YbaB